MALTEQQEEYVRAQMRKAYEIGRCGGFEEAIITAEGFLKERHEEVMAQSLGGELRRIRDLGKPAS